MLNSEKSGKAEVAHFGSGSGPDVSSKKQDSARNPTPVISKNL